MTKANMSLQTKIKSSSTATSTFWYKHVTLQRVMIVEKGVCIVERLQNPIREQYGPNQPSLDINNGGFTNGLFLKLSRYFYRQRCKKSKMETSITYIPASRNV